MGYRLSQFYNDRHGAQGAWLQYSYVNIAPKTPEGYLTVPERTARATAAWHGRTSAENVASLRHEKGMLDWTFLTMHNSINIRDILEAPDMPWNLLALHGRYDFDPELVKDYPFLAWNWTALIHVYNDTMFGLIKSHPDAPWNWESLARVCSWTLKERLQQLIDAMPDRAFRTNLCGSIGWETVGSNMDRPWNLAAMSRRAPWWLVARHPNAGWCPGALTARPDLPRALLLAAPHLIRWRKVWRRPWVTEDFVRRHWSLPWRGPSKNKKRDEAARVIQNAWRLNVWYNPHTGPGRRRLLREYGELVAEP